MVVILKVSENTGIVERGNHEFRSLNPFFTFSLFQQLSATIPVELPNCTFNKNDTRLFKKLTENNYK